MSERTDIIDGSETKGRTYGLVYTKKCGWVDLGHANPVGGVAVLWNKIRWERGFKGRSSYYSIIYSQNMKKEKFGVTLTASASNKYEIKKRLNLIQKRAVTLAIFLGVSHKFESLQSSFPYNLGTNSGYSAEDLVSDLIGFYRAIYPEENILQLCEPVSKEIALEICDTYGAVGINKNYTTQPFLYPHPGSQNLKPVSTSLPTLFNTVKPAKEGVLFRRLKPGSRGRR